MPLCFFIQFHSIKLIFILIRFCTETCWDLLPHVCCLWALTVLSSAHHHAQLSTISHALKRRFFIACWFKEKRCKLGQGSLWSACSRPPSFGGLGELHIYGQLMRVCVIFFIYDIYKIYLYIYNIIVFSIIYSIYKCLFNKDTLHFYFMETLWNVYCLRTIYTRIAQLRSLDI